MGFGIKLKVWGDYACFTRPEMKVERVSYDVMTPSAARGILEAIYWKPAIRWVIDKIIVINPIIFESIRRNELLGVITKRDIESAMYGRKNEIYQSTSKIVQKAALILRDVCYYIEAHFVLTDQAGPGDTEDKHYAIAVRRMKKGQCFHRAYFGCREFPVRFKYIEESEEVPESYYHGTKLDLGYMLWDIDYFHDNNSIFYRPIMENGIIEVPDMLETR